jgi:hypothetical protein
LAWADYETITVPIGDKSVVILSAHGKGNSDAGKCPIVGSREFLTYTSISVTFVAAVEIEKGAVHGK